MEPRSPALQVNSLAAEPQEKPSLFQGHSCHTHITTRIIFLISVCRHDIPVTKITDDSAGPSEWMTSYRRPFLTCPVHLCSLLSYQMPTLTLHSSYSKLLAVPRMCLTYSCHWTFTSASGFPGGVSDKALACQRRRCKRRWFDPWVGRILWKRAWQHTPVFLPGESCGQRSLADVVRGVTQSWMRLKLLSMHAQAFTWALLCLRRLSPAPALPSLASSHLEFKQYSVSTSSRSPRLFSTCHHHKLLCR